MLYYDDSRLALNAAANSAPACVGYVYGKGWIVYNPTDGCPTNCEPEFFIAKRGIHPFPLTKTAVEVWLSGVMASALVR